MGKLINISLRVRILSGYLILIAVIGSMTAILLHEHRRMLEIERETADVHRIRLDNNRVHRHITELATRGENAIAWKESDYREYRQKRQQTDSLLQSLKKNCGKFIRPEQIDTLCRLLAKKEDYLFHIMEAVRKQDEADSLLTDRLLAVTKQAGQPRTITRKKKGLAGLFGKKETVQVTPKAKKTDEINNNLIAIQTGREQQLSVYTDLLNHSNKELNRKLYTFIAYLNGQAQDSFKSREDKIMEAQEYSFRLIALVLAAALVLLVISYLIILRDLKRDARLRTKMEGIINKNHDLLETRKNVILTISHDIRGPLGSINGSAELAMDARDRRKRNNHLTNIQTSCRHILHLVNNLLDVYRMNEYKETRNDIPFRPDRLIERMAAGYSRNSNDKGILFTIGLSGLDTTVKGDADRIEQILDNLLVNAVKFTEAGEIRLNAAYADGRLTMEVSDTGIGMSEETLARIFEPFERAAQATSPEGFGLGLSITKGLVSLLGGEITVESATGKGSTFRVILPLEPTDEKEECENRTPSGKMRLPRRVLVVDDDAVQLEIIKEMLERNGVNCTTCIRAKEVVRVLREQDTDLILTDIQMSGTNGFELLKLLRNSHIGNSRSVPVMAMTARGDWGACDFAETGFSGCISKPFSSKELLAFISSILPQEKEENGIADFKELIAEAGDKRKILELFIEESERNIQELQEALKNTDREKLRTTVHRMLPVWELLQADAPLSAYSRILLDENIDKETIREETDKITDCIRELIVLSGNKIVYLEHEEEDTDC